MGDLGDKVRALARGARVAGRHAHAAAAQATTWYLDHAHVINPPIIFIGGSALAASYANQYAQAEPVELMLMAGATAGYVAAMKMASRIQELPWKVAAWAGITASAIVGLELARSATQGLDQLLMAEFYRRAFDPTYNLPLNLGVGWAALGAMKAAPQILKKIYAADRRKPVGNPKRYVGGLTRRDITRYLANTAALTITAASVGRFGPLLVSGFGKQSAAQPGYIEPREEQFGLYASLEGSKDVRTDAIEKDDIVNITLELAGLTRVANKTLSVRYFMLNDDHASALGDDSELEKRLISLGERHDLDIDSRGNGRLAGFFQYAPESQHAFQPETPFINPSDGFNFQSDRFSFLTQIVDSSGNTVISKWWGLGDERYRMRFRKPTAEDVTKEESPLPRVPRRPGQPKLFVYKQALSSNRFENKFDAVMDVFQPHLYELRWHLGALRLGAPRGRDGKPIMGERGWTAAMAGIRRQAQRYGYEVLPMVSMFREDHIRQALEYPETTARMLREEVDRRGWHGIMIDFEDVDMGEEHKGALVNFMRILRREMPGAERRGRYKIGIAVSPRFNAMNGKSSDKAGYRHHGFYDYKNLAFQCDYLQIMGYDFHVGKTPRPILPESMIPRIVDYAFANVNEADQGKIVFLMPLYSSRWASGGRNRNMSSSGIGRLISTPGATTRMDDGELRIDLPAQRNPRGRVTTPARTVYAQTPAVYERRHDLLMEQGISNFGYWKQELASAGIADQIVRLKSR